MWAGVDAANLFLGVWADDTDAQVTGGCGSARDQLTRGGIDRRVPLIANHADVAIWAIRLAQAAADAVTFDFDLRAFPAVNGIDRAADEAIRVFATSAGASDQIMPEAQPIAFQPRDAAMRIGASLSAFVAPRAALQVEHKQLLGVEQALIEKLAQ